MSALRLVSAAARRAPRATISLQRRGYAEAASDKIKLSLVLPHQVRLTSLSFCNCNLPLLTHSMLSVVLFDWTCYNRLSFPRKMLYRSTLPRRLVTWVSSPTTSRQSSRCALVSWRSLTQRATVRNGLVRTAYS